MTTDTPSDEAIAAARDAIDNYNREISTGGEPHYPQWAADVLARIQPATTEGGRTR